MDSWLTDICRSQGIDIEVLADACTVDVDAVCQWGDLPHQSIPGVQVEVVALCLGLKTDELLAAQAAAVQSYENGQPSRDRIRSILESLRMQAQEPFDTAASVFKMKNAVENLPEVLTDIIVADIAAESGRYLKFFEQLVSQFKYEKDPLKSGALHDAVLDLISASAACYYDPNSFSLDPAKQVLSVKIPKLAELADHQARRDYVMSLFCRILSHNRFCADDQMSIYLNPSRHQFTSDGVNISIPLLRNGNAEEQFEDFICELAAHLLLDCPRLQPRWGPLSDQEERDREIAKNEQITTIKDALANGQLPSAVKFAQYGKDHPLTFSAIGDHSALIEEIERTFPTLPVYQFNDAGMNCFTIDRNVNDLAGFVERQFKLLENVIGAFKPTPEKTF